MHTILSLLLAPLVLGASLALPSGVRQIRPISTEAEAQAAERSVRVIAIAGIDHEGHLSLSNMKNWGTAAAAAQGLPSYPYFFDADAFGGQGIWTSIVAEPLSALAVYPEEGPATPVFNKLVHDPDYATRPVGRISFATDGLTRIGTEIVPPDRITIVFNDRSFSPLYSIHNSGSGVGNAGWDYLVDISALNGTGITLVDGAVRSIDLTGAVRVTVRFLGIDAGALAETYNGSVTFACNRFEFDVDVTQDNFTLLGPVEDTRLVLNRRGTIEAIEPCDP